MLAQLILNCLQQHGDALRLRDHCREHQHDRNHGDRDPDCIDEEHRERAMASKWPHALHPVHERGQDESNDAGEDEQQQDVEDVNEDEGSAFKYPDERDNDGQPDQCTHGSRVPEWTRRRAAPRAGS
jgi:hypothetical protein